MKLSEFDAQAIVDAWKADAIVAQVKDCLGGAFIPYNHRVRTAIAARCPLANQALWDGLFVRAKKILMHYGIEKENATSAAHRKVHREQRVAHWISSSRLSGDNRNPKSDWKYVK